MLWGIIIKKKKLSEKTQNIECGNKSQGKGGVKSKMVRFDLKSKFGIFRGKKG